VPAAYVFVDRWIVPEPIADVYDAIGMPFDSPILGRRHSCPATALPLE